MHVEIHTYMGVYDAKLVRIYVVMQQHQHQSKMDGIAPKTLQKNPSTHSAFSYEVGMEAEEEEEEAYLGNKLATQLHVYIDMRVCGGWGRERERETESLYRYIHIHTHTPKTREYTKGKKIDPIKKEREGPHRSVQMI